MLQIIFTLIILLFSSSSFAQSYQQGDVPAFLRNEAQQNRNYQQPQQQQVQDGSVPAFLQKESEEQQMYQQQMQQLQQQSPFNYQSADPNSTSYTLPPAVYQPAPGDTPAFLLQQQQQGQEVQPQPEQEQNFNSQRKEDTIQINFSDDQYKAEEEVTPLNKEEAKEYNKEVKQQEGAAATEIPEGAKFVGDVNPSQPAEQVIQPQTTTEEKPLEEGIVAEKQIATQAVPEPVKAEQNLIRISYAQEVTELSEKDKTSLLTVVRLLKSNKSQKVVLKANTSERDVGVSADKIGLMRVISIRDFLMKQGVDFSQTEVRVENSNRNKENLDYIDIDKI